MKRVLIVYATREGQTRRIAEHLAASLRLREVGADVHDVAAIRTVPYFEDYGTVIVAASLHMGRYEPQMVSFVREHRAKLEKMESAFISVSLTEATAEDPGKPLDKRLQAREEIQATIDAFIDATGWHPNRIRPVAGALAYTRYGYLKRLVMKMIARSEGGDTDTTKDHEYTDWAALDRFAEDVARSEDAPVEREPSAPNHSG